MSEFTVLLDSPGEPSRRYQIAKLGDFHHDSYGDFSITESQVRNWQANLAKLPGARALIDLDHRSERAPRNSEAAGWINAIDVEGERVMAEIDWTPVGEAAVKEKRYQFFSPVYGPFKDESGTTHPDTLVSAALTNKPALTGLPTISLASPERVREALEPIMLIAANDAVTDNRAAIQAAVNAASDPVDSPPAMRDLIKLLDLPEDADEAQVTQAVTALKEKAETEPEVKTLEQMADETDKVVLDSQVVAKLQLDAQAGAEAKRQLDAQTFDHAFKGAMREGRAVAADQEFYEGLPLEVAVKRLESAPKIVNVKPIGKSDAGLPDEAPEGVHPTSFLLDQAVRKYMTEHDMRAGQYLEALNAVQGSDWSSN